MRRLLRRLLAILLVAAVVQACATTAPPTSGISEADASARALAANSTATGIESARVGRIDEFDAGQAVVPPDTRVWAVVVSGTFPVSCGPAPAPGASPHPCPSPGRTRTVLLDYQTGAFIMSIGGGSVAPVPTPAAGVDSAAWVGLVGVGAALAIVLGITRPSVRSQIQRVLGSGLGRSRG